MRSVLKFLLWSGGVLLAIAAALFVAGYILLYTLFGGKGSAEVARAVSPDGHIEAVLVETNGGATTSFGYEVFAVSRGAKPSGDPVVSLYGATRSAQAYGLNLRWVSADEVAVQYFKAKAVKAASAKAEVDGKPIRITLQSGVADENAPPGGMLFNLNRKQKE